MKRRPDFGDLCVLRSGTSNSYVLRGGHPLGSASLPVNVPGTAWIPVGTFVLVIDRLTDHFPIGEDPNVGVASCLCEDGILSRFLYSELEVVE